MRAIAFFFVLCSFGSICYAQIAVENKPPAAGSDQERLDMITRAFERLPVDELERFDIDISTPVLVDTLRAENLKIAWSKRQEELKIAMANVVKPAEFMAEIALQLRENKQNLSDSLDSLRELESLLGDIDNSRDYYTIGGWSILTNMLNPEKYYKQHELAAWAMGTAVKNSYDFQLWLLESDHSHPSVLSLKKNKFVMNKENEENKENDNQMNDNNNQIKNNNNNKINSNIGDKNNKNSKNSAVSIDVMNINGTATSYKNDLKQIQNEKHVFSEQKMTGLEKLVSLLHLSYNHQIKPILAQKLNENHESKPNLDELQRKVLYAISAGSRGNMEVQEKLLNIQVKNLYPTEKYEMNKNKSDSDNEKNGGSRNNATNRESVGENSFFLHYLTSIAENEIHENIENKGISVSYELLRKVWTYITDMLEERAYIRGELILESDLPKESIEELKSMELIGDSFLTEKWLNLGVKTFSKLFKVYMKHKNENVNNVEINIIGEIKSIEKREITEITKITKIESNKASSKIIVRALLENILIVIKEMMFQDTKIYDKFAAKVTAVKNKENNSDSIKDSEKDNKKDSIKENDKENNKDSGENEYDKFFYLLDEIISLESEISENAGLVNKAKDVVNYLLGNGIEAEVDTLY